VQQSIAPDHRKGWIVWELTLFENGHEFASHPAVIPAHAGIQYAAAYPFDRRPLWNTGSSAFADDDIEGAASRYATTQTCFCSAAFLSLLMISGRDQDLSHLLR
jgi:hypothetical protein